jgi:hypothetical protein
MKRNKPLRADPEKVRQWQQRSRRKRSKPQRATPRTPPGELTMGEWREAVFNLCEGKCVVTGVAVSLGDSFLVWNAHHAIREQILRRHGASTTDPRVGVVLIADIHRKHTDRFKRVPLEALPSYVSEYATELGDWATRELLREHPHEPYQP